MTLPADTCDCCSKHSDSPSVEAFEITGDIMCADCWDTYCERQWDSQFEGEPPVSLDEQHRAAWAQKQALRSRGFTPSRTVEIGDGQ